MRVPSCNDGAVFRRNGNRFAAASILAASLLLSVSGSGASFAQIDLSSTVTELSKESENPVSQVMTIPLRYQADFKEGAYDATKQSFELSQAVVPFALGDDWSLITRTKLPMTSEPPSSRGASWEFGLGNGYTTFFLSPSHGEGLFWGAGPVLYYPASSHPLGVERWGAGPSAAFLKKDNGPWVLGVVVNNIWSFGTDQFGRRTDELLVNPFLAYHFGDGWSLGTSPNITADWVSKPGQRWTVPLGGGISKTLSVGALALKFSLDAYANAARPEWQHDPWQLQSTLTFLFPE